MAKIDIEQIKADREAGTQGPWLLEEDELRSDGLNILSIWRDDDKVCEVTGYGDDGPSVKDARRIARVPDYEDALIEAVELLRGLKAQNENDGCSGAAWEIGNFLERFK